MLTLLLWWTGGVLLRFLFSLAFDPGYRLKDNYLKFALAVLIGILPSYILSKMGVMDWPAFIVMATAGFLSQYVLEWINKRKG